MRLLEQIHSANRGSDVHLAGGRRTIEALSPQTRLTLDRERALAEGTVELRAAILGDERLRALEADLRKVAPSGAFPLDVPGWFGS